MGLGLLLGDVGKAGRGGVELDLGSRSFAPPRCILGGRTR